MDAEGCFLLNLHKSPDHVLKERIALRFIVTQHTRDSHLLGLLVTYLGCGIIRSNLDNTKGFVVTRYSDIYNKIMPFFEKYPLVGAKYNDFVAFKKGVNIIKDKAHLTQEGLNEIRLIKASMNSANRNVLSEESSEDI